ncbi:hypothetical protein, partial [Klebsiella pneumoniae]|uniref:hypothetical protein n=1 Tax=Klebsiella pneumoniae TaxID=573 RepID=UPI0040557660
TRFCTKGDGFQFLAKFAILPQNANSQKKEDGFSGHVKEKGRGLGISAIFIKKIQKPARSWFLAWLIIILVEGIQQ